MRPYKIETVEKLPEKIALAWELAVNLRDVDRREIEGMGVTVWEGIARSIVDTPPVYTGRAADTGELVCCWGLQTLPGPRYIIWALGTDEMDAFKKPFVKGSKKIISEWAEKYGCLENTVACFNKRAIRWLKSLGAEFEPPQEINGIEYVNFKIRKERETKCAVS